MPALVFDGYLQGESFEYYLKRKHVIELLGEASSKNIQSDIRKIRNQKDSLEDKLNNVYQDIHYCINNNNQEKGRSILSLYLDVCEIIYAKSNLREYIDSYRFFVNVSLVDVPFDNIDILMKNKVMLPRTFYTVMKCFKDESLIPIEVYITSFFDSRNLVKNSKIDYSINNAQEFDYFK